MAKAYSIDLREKVANASGSCKEIAARFGVSETSVRKYKSQQRRDGHLETLYLKTSHRKLLDDEKMMALKNYVESNKNATQVDMCRFMMDKYGVKIAQSTMHNYLKRIKVSLKKSNSETRKQILKK